MSTALQHELESRQCPSSRLDMLDLEHEATAQRGIVL